MTDSRTTSNVTDIIAITLWVTAHETAGEVYIRSAARLVRRGSGRPVVRGMKFRKFVFNPVGRS